MARILVIDDEDNIRASLKSALERRSHEVVTAATYAEGHEFAAAGFDIILLDIMLPDGNGMDLLRSVILKNPNQLVVMISGQADIDLAMEAIRAGAYDFFEKPLSLDRVLITIENATRTNQLITEKDRLASQVYGEMIGESESIQKLKEEITLAAGKTTRFLILGENGTGKELVAHMIHRKSQFSDGPFVAVNCAALPAELIESELFGHTAQAFTGARKPRKGKFVEADRGTIFLDEISEMPAEAQAKILRAIETREIVPVGAEKEIKISGNIVAASNRDLYQMTEAGKFRRDLLYRLNVVQYEIPPLRERVEDIPALANFFLKRFATESSAATKTLSDESLDLLLKSKFPGNIRQLKNLMERLNIFCAGPVIDAEEMKKHLPDETDAGSKRLKEAVAEFEQRYIKGAIARNRGNISRAARELGLERSHLYKKLKRKG